MVIEQRFERIPAAAKSRFVDWLVAFGGGGGGGAYGREPTNDSLIASKTAVVVLNSM